jgi:hypothetical protein
MTRVTLILPNTAPEPMLENAIRERAYQLYERRGKTHGHAVDDCLQAEAELVHGQFIIGFNLKGTEIQQNANQS